MRYFRYNHTCKNLNNALTDQYKSLIRCEKRILQKEKIWRRFSAVLSFIIFIAAVTAGFFLLKSIPQSDGWLMKKIWAAMLSRKLRLHYPNGCVRNG